MFEQRSPLDQNFNFEMFKYLFNWTGLHIKPHISNSLGKCASLKLIFYFKTNPLGQAGALNNGAQESSLKP